MLPQLPRQNRPKPATETSQPSRARQGPGWCHHSNRTKQATDYNRRRGIPENAQVAEPASCITLGDYVLFRELNPNHVFKPGEKAGSSKLRMCAAPSAVPFAMAAQSPKAEDTAQSKTRPGKSRTRPITTSSHPTTPGWLPFTPFANSRYLPKTP